MKKRPFHHEASSQIFKNAQDLRKSQTEAEKLLWKILRDRNLAHLKFRRQHPIDRFIVDFYCHKLQLIIELDGDVHDLETAKEKDIKRENKLKALGLKIIRFRNEQVKFEAEEIERTILAFC